MSVSLVLIEPSRYIQRHRTPSSSFLASVQCKNHQNTLQDGDRDSTYHCDSFEGPGGTSLRRWGGTVLDERAPIKLFREAGRLRYTWHNLPSMVS